VPLAHQVDFAASISGGIRLSRIDLLEPTLHQPLELRETAALERFDDDIPTWLQPASGEIEG
jgi:hypothetical protein